MFKPSKLIASLAFLSITLMSETVCVGGKFEMLMTDFEHNRFTPSSQKSFGSRETVPSLIILIHHYSLLIAVRLVIMESFSWMNNRRKNLSHISVHYCCLKTERTKCITTNQIIILWAPMTTLTWFRSIRAGRGPAINQVKVIQITLCE